MKGITAKNSNVIIFECFLGSWILGEIQEHVPTKFDEETMKTTPGGILASRETFNIPIQKLISENEIKFLDKKIFKKLIGRVKKYEEARHTLTTTVIECLAIDCSMSTYG